MGFFSISEKKGLKFFRFFEQFRVKKVISKFSIFFSLNFLKNFCFDLKKK